MITELPAVNSACRCRNKLIFGQFSIELRYYGKQYEHVGLKFLLTGFFKTYYFLIIRYSRLSDEVVTCDVDRNVLTDTASLHQAIRSTGCVSPFRQDASIGRTRCDRNVVSDLKKKARIPCCRQLRSCSDRLLTQGKTEVDLARCQCDKMTK